MSCDKLTRVGTIRVTRNTCRMSVHEKDMRRNFCPISTLNDPNLHTQEHRRNVAAGWISAPQLRAVSHVDENIVCTKGRLLSGTSAVQSCSDWSWRLRKPRGGLGSVGITKSEWNVRV